MKNIGWTNLLITTLKVMLCILAVKLLWNFAHSDWSMQSIYSMNFTFDSKFAEENMRFTQYELKKEISKGKNFSSYLKTHLDRWKISDRFHYDLKPINASNVVFVTYASSNHFLEARKGIRSMRSAFQNKIIFFDVGLKEEEANELRSVCNLEVRKFNFTKYPQFVARLGIYSFKAIIMAEVFSEFEHYWLVDASIRFSNDSSLLREFYSKVSNGTMESIVLRDPSSHSIFAATHPGVFEYLPMSVARSKRVMMLCACAIFVARSEMSRQAAKWNALCGLTEDCMTPKGSSVYCNFGPNRYNTYANCTRYDQSSINIIVESLLERDGWKRRDQSVNDMAKFISVQREDKENQRLSIPCV